MIAVASPAAFARAFVDRADGACDEAMNLGDHHDWIDYATKRPALTSSGLWHAMCGEWTERCLANTQVKEIDKYLEDRLLEYANLSMPRFFAAFGAMSARCSG